MSATIFSLLAAILWCNVYIGIIALAWKRTSFSIRFSTVPLIFLIVAGIARLLCFFELPYTIIIPSKKFIPFFYNFLILPQFTIPNSNIILRVLDILPIIWLTGSIYFFQKYIRQSIQLNKGIQRMPATQDPRILAAMRSIVSASEKNIEVRIIQSEFIHVPMITGYFKPIIYLPDIQFSDTDLTNILSHEWMHFMHKHIWLKSLTHWTCLLFWWNPFTHFLKSDLDHLLEIQCDLRLTAEMNESARSDYLSSILKIIKSKTLPPKLPIFNQPVNAAMLVSAGNAAKLKQRFYLVQNYHSVQQKHRFASSVICICILLSFFASFFFIIQPVYPVPTTDEGIELFSITPETAYLKQNEDGDYSLYAEGLYRNTIDQKYITKEPYSSLLVE